MSKTKRQDRRVAKAAVAVADGNAETAAARLRLQAEDRRGVATLYAPGTAQHTDALNRAARLDRAARFAEAMVPGARPAVDDTMEIEHLATVEAWRSA